MCAARPQQDYFSMNPAKCKRRYHIRFPVEFGAVMLYNINNLVMRKIQRKGGENQP
jgi:hypothetical protein